MRCSNFLLLLFCQHKDPELNSTVTDHDGSRFPDNYDDFVMEEENIRKGKRSRGLKGESQEVRDLRAIAVSINRQVMERSMLIPRLPDERSSPCVF
jgi:hypothetical protein